MMSSVSLVGKIIFVEAVDPKTAYPGYGEFLVIRETPNSLYVVKYASSGYDAGNEQQLYKSKYAIITVSEDPAGVRRFIEQLRRFADTPNRGEKLAWIKDVYDRAARVADELERVYGVSVPTAVSYPVASQHALDAASKRITALEQELGSLKVRLRSV